jgi:hypothetical protein
VKNSSVREILKAKLPEPGGGSMVELGESYLDASTGDTQLKFRFTRTTPTRLRHMILNFSHDVFANFYEFLIISSQLLLEVVINL